MRQHFTRVHDQEAQEVVFGRGQLYLLPPHDHPPSPEIDFQLVYSVHRLGSLLQ